MPQKSNPTTTSFAVSSVGSLYNPSLSSHRQSSDSDSNLTKSDSAQSYQYSCATSNQLDDKMMINQPYQQSSDARLGPPQTMHPSNSPSQGQEVYYGTLAAPNGIDNVPHSQQQQHYTTYQEIYQTNQNLKIDQSANRHSTVLSSTLYSNYGVSNFQSSQNSTDILEQPLQNLRISQDQISSSTIIDQPGTANRAYLQHSPSNQRSSNSSLDSSTSTPLMPINVKGMLLHGLPSEEVMRNWLVSIKCEDHIKNFLEHGYDMHLVTRMTPQDLAAIGCKSPALRKKLISEIKKLNIDDNIPDSKPTSLDKWLELLRLGQYYSRLVSEGCETVDKVCKLTWEDLEEIGITRLGHQKKLLLAIEKVQKLTKLQEDRQNDNAIYDVHPNHRISLSENRLGTLGRVRSGVFQTRTGANLDHRGLPVAKVMPALKHVNSSLMNQLDNQQMSIQTSQPAGDVKSTSEDSTSISSNSTRPLSNDQKLQPIYDSYKNNYDTREETLKMSDLAATLKRNPPPLPPVRTNSLKFPQGPSVVGAPQQSFGNNSNINNHLPYIQTTHSTSFLRTPKIGTLTATTNKMLTVGGGGGHFQTTNVHDATMRTIVPIREAPLPPNQQPIPRTPPTIHENGDEESSTDPNNMSSNSVQLSTLKDRINANLISSSSIGHQLASADEFPPPPPVSQ